MSSTEYGSTPGSEGELVEITLDGNVPYIKDTILQYLMCQFKKIGCIYYLNHIHSTAMETTTNTQDSSTVASTTKADVSSTDYGSTPGSGGEFVEITLDCKVPYIKDILTIWQYLMCQFKKNPMYLLFI